MRRLRGVGSVGVALVVAGLSCTGCTSARSSLGTSDDSCYLALPTAAQAIGTGSHGHMVGLREFTIKGLKGTAPHLYKVLAGSAPASQSICVVAYTGHFKSGDVTNPKGHPMGTFAVVVATSPANKVLGTFIFERVPLHFGHTHVG